MDARTALQALLRGWYFILLGVVAAVVAAVALSASEPPSYAAESTYVVSPAPNDDAFEVAEGVRTLDSSRSRAIMATYTEIIASQTVLADAAAGLGLTPADLEPYSITAAVVPEANVALMRVSGPDPELTASLSTAVGQVAAERFITLYQIYAVQLLDPPQSPAPRAPGGLLQTAALATALGLAGGSGMALLWHAPRMRRRRLMESRLDAYGDGGNVTRLSERFPRAG